MEICHPHNLTEPLPDARPFGIRVSLPPGDSFLSVIGSDWERLHWFATYEEREAALRDMQGEHIYSRRGDRPTTLFTRIDP